MTSPIIMEIEKEQMKKDIPAINIGDKVNISNVIIEGKKQRIQHFEGIVTEFKKNYSRQSITVRKIIDSIGVEKTFLVHSPLVSNIKIVQKGKVRRSKLYYLRNRIGIKARKIKVRE
jgi:large subunit ribosomal protein L19